MLVLVVVVPVLVLVVVVVVVVPVFPSVRLHRCCFVPKRGRRCSIIIPGFNNGASLTRCVIV